MGEINDSQALITADVRDDDAIVSVWAVIYKPSDAPPKVGEEMVQEKRPTVQLQDVDGDGIYSAPYKNFNEVGQYRIVVYAVDTDNLQASPQEVTVQTGRALYLPMVIR